MFILLYFFSPRLRFLYRELKITHISNSSATPKINKFSQHLNDFSRSENAEGFSYFAWYFFLILPFKYVSKRWRQIVYKTHLYFGALLSTHEKPAILLHRLKPTAQRIHLSLCSGCGNSHVSCYRTWSRLSGGVSASGSCKTINSRSSQISE